MQPNERCACYTTPRTPGWRLEWERHRRQVELTRNALCVAAGALLGAAPLIGWLVAPLLFG